MGAISVKQSDVKSENKLLSLMFDSEDVIDIIIDNGITDNIFTYPLNKDIFNGVVDIYRDVECGGIAIGDDINILSEYLKSGDTDVDRELLLQINKIRNAKADRRHVNIYLKTLNNLFKIRSIIQANRNITNYIKDNDDVNADELINIYDESYQMVSSSILGKVQSVSTKEAVNSTIKEIIDDSTKETLVKFNLSGVDEYGVIPEGYLTYIVGDTGLGKTTLSANLISSCADNGLKILYINLETKTSDCIKKLISSRCSLNNNRIKYTRLINPTLLTDTDWDILEDIAVNDRLAEMGIYWIHNSSMTDRDLYREIVRHVRMYDIDVVVGDYYQLLLKEGYEDAAEGVAIPKVSKSLMEMAGKRYVNSKGVGKFLTHIWLAQANKEIIYRQEKRPQKEDIYFGGQRDARLILGIYRDEYYNQETKKPNVFEIGILKQNNGIANVWFDYMFEAQYQTIREMTDEEKEILEENQSDDEY